MPKIHAILLSLEQRVKRYIRNIIVDRLEFVFVSLDIQVAALGYFTEIMQYIYVAWGFLVFVLIDGVAAQKGIIFQCLFFNVFGIKL